MEGYLHSADPLYIHKEDEMTTLADLRSEHVLPLFSWVPNEATRLLVEKNAVPLVGVIYYRAYGVAQNFTFYLATENGEMAQHKPVEGSKTIHDVIFDADESRQRIAAVLGIESDQIGLSEGDEKYENNMENCCVRWKFLYLDIEKFEVARKSKRVSIVAEEGTNSPIQRWVAPNAVRIRNAGFDFDIKTAKLQFVAKHNNSIEYVTDTGIKVFDNRRSHVGFSDGGIYGTGKMEPTIIREDCLREFLYAIWRGHKAKRSADKETERLRDYAGWALERLALNADEVARKEVRIIAQGIELLYGEPFVPAAEMFGEWYTRHGHVSSWNKSMLLRDAGSRDALKEEDNKLVERYVVLND